MKDYKKILKGVVNIINNTEKSDIGFDNICAYIGENCPELKESEDKQHRKWILDYLYDGLRKSDEQFNGHFKAAIAWLEKQGQKETTYDEDMLGAIEYCKKNNRPLEKEHIAWLEKQGEDKPVISDDALREGIAHFGITQYQIDNWLKKYVDVENPTIVQQKDFASIEPKFKAGEWVVCELTGSVYQIKNCVEHLSNHKYGYVLTNGGYIGSDEVNHYHLWTIKDAKDGDVLATLDYILVFKEFLKNDGGISYCHYDFGGEYPQFIWFEDKNWYFGKEAIIHPATQEQRDLLFQKMKEAGYEWNVEELRLDKVEPKFKVGDWIVTPGNKVLQITSIEGTSYRFNNESHYWEICYCDEKCHLWTLDDARDGDVLCVKYGNDELPFIFTGKQDDVAYCALNSFGEFVLSIVEWLLKTSVLPATKEQCDLLFQKMKEAGYEWDAEKKELKKVEQNHRKNSNN